MHAADDDQESPLRNYTMGIATQPVAVAGVIGGQAVFTVAFVGGAYAYQWQIQTDGITWINLVETAGYYEGVTTDTLTVKAIDNFLSSRPSCNFRCVGFKSAFPLPTFTLGAALTVAKHLNYRIGYNVFAICPTNQSIFVDPQQPDQTADATGFVPTSYLWQFVSGDAGFAILNPADQFPIITFQSATPGFFKSYWTCTASDGVTTLTTEPRLWAVSVDDAYSPEVINWDGADNSTKNGEAFRVGFNQYNFALLPITQRERVAATPLVTVYVPPSAPVEYRTTFPLCGGGTYPGGTLIVGFLTNDFNPGWLGTSYSGDYR